METVSERFLRYVSFDTQSNEFSETCPSTDKQKLLGAALVEEMLAMGIKDAHMDENGYIYGTKGYIRMPFFYMAKEFYVADAYHKERHIEKPRIGAGFEEEIIEVCNCIREGKTQSDIMPMSESIKILEQMDIIREQIGLKYPQDK